VYEYTALHPLAMCRASRRQNLKDFLLPSLNRTSELSLACAASAAARCAVYSTVLRRTPANIAASPPGPLLRRAASASLASLVRIAAISSTLRWTVSRETVDFVDADGAVAEDEMDLAG